jgi:hypothetical protein
MRSFPIALRSYYFYSKKPFLFSIALELHPLCIKYALTSLYRLPPVC